jgi:Sphingolipid Delta4-desaturase (DES)
MPSNQTSDFSYFGGAESLNEGRAPRRTAVPLPTAEDDGKSFTRPPQDPSDFLWIMTEEPHRSRRMEIMKAHPEARMLYPGCIHTHLSLIETLGDEAYGPRASHQIRGCVCCSPSAYYVLVFA